MKDLIMFVELTLAMIVVFGVIVSLVEVTEYIFYTKK
jgi:hypothetical protein